MIEINCQYCGPDDDGCEICGGYRVVLLQTACPTCKHVYWVKPGVKTMYDKKRWFSFDGLELICNLGKNQTCIHCETDGS